jgi:hypothetical protein
MIAILGASCALSQPKKEIPMKKIFWLTFVATAIFAAGSFRSGATRTQAKETDLVVHEWGTFTAIAGGNGVALDWKPLNGASDLPTFVYNITKDDGYRGTYGSHGKGDISRVRMETPVIYFYTKREMELNVSVEFPQGRITEWYPQAGVVNNTYGQDRGGNFHSGITWGQIRLMPNAQFDLPREAAYSHYYPARETDSTTIQICNADKSRVEHEKFLFYRGIGNFDLPLSVKLERAGVVLDLSGPVYSTKGNSGHNLHSLMVFENRGGRVGFTTVPSVSGPTPVARPQLNMTVEQAKAELERILLLQGLYPKEAQSMIKTWSDSWFEEGLRVFYILPRLDTDEILPLQIDVPTKERIRVLVGRTEVVTPEMEQAVKRQVVLLGSPSETVRQGAQENLKKYGRFYEPILRSILQRETDAAVRTQLEQLIAAA